MEIRDISITIVPYSETTKEKLAACCAQVDANTACLLISRNAIDELPMQFNEAWSLYFVESDIFSPLPGTIYIAAKGFYCITDGDTIFAMSANSAVSDQTVELARQNIDFERIKALFENSEEGLCILSPQGKAIFVSSSVERILGYTLSDLEPLRLDDLVHVEDKHVVNKVLTEAMNLPGVKIDGGVVRMLHKNGEWRYCEASITNMLHDPAIQGIIDGFRDVTVRVLAERELLFMRNKLSALMENSPDAIWSMDTNFLLQTANANFIRSAQEWLGREVGEGDSLTTLFYSMPAETGFWKNKFEAVKRGEVQEFELKTIDIKSGEDVWIQARLNPIMSHGKVMAIAGYIHDVTAYVTKSEMLKDAIANLKHAQDIANLGYWGVSLDSKKAYWSEGIYKVLELDQEIENLSFESSLEFVHPDDKDDYRKAVENALAEKSKVDITHRAITAKGNIKWLRHIGEISTDEQGRALLLRGSSQDITHQKKVENTLEERNAFIEKIIEELPIGVAINNTKTGETLYVNPNFSKIYGWPAKDLTNVEGFFRNVYPDPEFRQNIRKRIMADIASGDAKRMQWRDIPIKTQNGELRYVYAVNIPLPEQDTMISTVQNVTDVVLHRKALIESNQNYAYACKASFDALWDLDIEAQLIRWGEGFTTHFGHKTDSGKTSLDYWAKLVHPEDRLSTNKSFNKAIQDYRQHIWKEEYRMLRSDGSYAYVIDRGYILRDDNKKATRMIGAIQDMSTKKIEEENLRLRESAMNNASEAIIIGKFLGTDHAADKVVFANKACLHMLNLTSEQIIGKNSELIFSGDPNRETLEHYRNSRQNASKSEQELKITLQNGHVKWLNISLSFVPNPDSRCTHFICILRDVTDRVNYVQLLQEQNKRLKDIAFTQSHVVRAPLARLMGAVELIGNMNVADEEYTQILSSVQLSARELDTIVRAIVKKTEHNSNNQSN